MKKLLGAITLLLLPFFVFAAQPAELAAKVIHIKAATVDAQTTKNNATEVFMELVNNGANNHELIAATSPLAKRVQLHKTTHHFNHMGMKQINKVIIKRHAEKDLQMGGLHVMLMGLKRKLVKGQHIPITLIFHDGSWKTVIAKVAS